MVLDAQWCGRALWLVQKPLISQSASVGMEATGALLPLARLAEPPEASGKVSPGSLNMPGAASCRNVGANAVLADELSETDGVSSDCSPNFLNRLLTVTDLRC